MGCGSSVAAKPGDEPKPAATAGMVTSGGSSGQKAVLTDAGGDPFEGCDPRVVEAFKLMDKNGDNELSTAEVLYALRKQESVRALLGLEAVKFSDSPSKAAFDAAFAKMDADTSSMISPKELDAFLKSALAQEGPPALELSLKKAIDVWGKSVFAQFDTDRNGVLDQKELTRALKALPKTKPTMAPPNAKYMSVEDMIVAMDADGSGGVDETEWLANLSTCAGLAAALAENVGESGVVDNFRSFEQQKAKREKEIAEMEAKMMDAAPEELEKLAAEMAEYERQAASLATKIEEAAANAAARATGAAA